MIKRILTLTCCIINAVLVFSQIADGYYRVCNYATERYIYIVDNKCNTPIPDNMSQAAIGTILDQGIDFGSIAILSGREKTVSDASSILYITKNQGATGDQGYNITGQNVSTYQMLNRYFSIKKNVQNGQYSPYLNIENYGVQYLYDRESTIEMEKGKLDIKETTNIQSKYGKKLIDFRSWTFQPVSSETDNYFGISPTVQIADKYYASFFTGFPFKTASKGMKVYTVTKVENGVAVIKDITDGTVPAATPVIIECSSSSPSDNRLDFVTDKTATPSDNLLKGAYYMNTRQSHKNVVAYNKNTMRVLGTTKDGRLGMITASNLENIPANSSYLQLAGSVKSEYILMTETEYSEYLKELSVNNTQSESWPCVVYSILGTLVSNCCYSTDELENGIYIINGKKVIVDR